MRSLLHQTTLTITAVLVLISCATQTQAAGGPDIRIQGQSLYARSFFTKEKAAEEGLSDLQWFGKVGSATSFATLTYDGKPAYMACTTKDNYKLGFEALVSARTTLKGANEEYRNYVKNPLKPVEVTAGPSRPAGYCFVYRNIGGMHLEQFMEHKNYADRLVILSQIMPQILKGKLLIYAIQSTHVDTDLRKVMIEQQLLVN
ncbi:hypothetical protein BDF22DRAFT_656979 [Syncephalis plumigaleata]|nr:hypothetical protein BDF22DRAFT_656979 [Syncephalis plumigaleata]